MSATFASLRWRIIRHGPHDERGFGLITGLIAAAAVVTVAALAATGTLHSSWLTVAVSAFGLTWLIGPILLPGAAPLLDPQWIRTLPRRPASIARDMTASEAISVGTLITAVALSSMIVLATPHGAAAVVIAVVALVAQLFFLLWTGRCAAAVVARMLRSSLGMWLAAFQMGVLLAISFAGWVPLVSAVFPRIAEGDPTLVTPPVPGAVPSGLEDVLLALPTGWGLAAVGAAASAESLLAVAAPLAGLLAGGLLLRGLWIALTAHAISWPPARAQSNITARRPRGTPRHRPGDGSRGRPRGALHAASVRELKTWFRDPHRILGLGNAWFTSLLMIPLVAPTSWSWALPFVGVMAAGMGAMVAVNTYALDGTALWQLLTTPGALRADVRGRHLAWMLLFGLPTLGLTVLLALLSQSPFGSLAIGMTLAATGAACAAAPLFSALMPAFGADARDRVSTADEEGNAAGGQFTVLFAVLAAVALPVVTANLLGLGSAGLAHLLLGGAVGTLAIWVLTPVTRTYLEQRGQALLSAMSARDLARLRRQISKGRT